MPGPMIGEVLHRFEGLAPDTDAIVKIKATRADYKHLASDLIRRLPPGRETSLALTALEESMHWANKAISIANDPAV